MQQVALLSSAHTDEHPSPLHYWQVFLSALEVDVVYPTLPPAELHAVGKDSLQGAPAQVQLLLGQLLSLPRAGLALLPQPLPFAGDPWSEALEEVLPRRISALPELLPVPISGGDAGAGGALRSVATTLGQRLTGNPGLVRRALERVQPLERLSHAPPRWDQTGTRTVGVVLPRSAADPAFVAPLRAALAAAGLHPVWSQDLPAEDLQRRAERFGALSPGEAEIMGAGNMLGGKGAVRGVLYALPARDTAARRAAERSRAAQHRPSALIELEPGAAPDAAVSEFAQAVG